MPVNWEKEYKKPQLVKLVKQCDSQGSEAVKLLFEANEELSHKAENEKLRRKISALEISEAKLSYELTRVSIYAQKMTNENAMLKENRLICSSCHDRDGQKKILEKASEEMEKDKNEIEVTKKVVKKLISSKVMVDRGSQPGHFCHTCEKTYLEAENLNLHMMLVHEVKKPNSVKKPNCEKKPNNDSVGKESVGKDSVEKESVGKEYVGKDSVGKESVGKDSVGKDMKKTNDVKKPFQCSICLASFLTGEEAKSHFESIHEEEQFSCCECSVNFSLKIHLDRHIADVHEEKFSLVEASSDMGPIHQNSNEITIKSEEQVEAVHEEKSPEKSFCVEAKSDFIIAKKLLDSNESFRLVVSNSLLETREYKLFVGQIQDLPLPTPSEIDPVISQSSVTLEKCPKCKEDWLIEDLPNHLTSCEGSTESKQNQNSIAVTGEKTDLCSFCNKYFKGQKNLKAHIKRMHSVGKESVGKESVEKESVGNESVGKDLVGKESVGKESVGKESVEKDSVEKDSVEKESVGKDSVGKESVGKDSAGEV